MTPLLNRWGLECAGEVIEVREAFGEQFCDVRVWNLFGPGADHIVTDVPSNILKLDILKPKLPEDIQIV